MFRRCLIYLFSEAYNGIGIMRKSLQSLALSPIFRSLNRRVILIDRCRRYTENTQEKFMMYTTLHIFIHMKNGYFKIISSKIMNTFFNFVDENNMIAVCVTCDNFCNDTARHRESDVNVHFSIDQSNNGIVVIM